jgi:hypothetical protein
MPNAANVAPADYAFGIVDTILHDPEVRERGCEPGFSAAIFVCALRKVSRVTKFVPSSAEILEACQFYRTLFREMRSNVALLIDVRENAEKVIAEHEIPWLADEKDEPEGRRQKAQGAYVEIPDEELPF